MSDKRAKMFSFSMAILLSLLCVNTYTQNPDNEMVIRPVEIYDVLTNPGMGFMTFQRFNGDELNEGNGWTEDFPSITRNLTGI